MHRCSACCNILKFLEFFLHKEARLVINERFLDLHLTVARLLASKLFWLYSFQRGPGQYWMHILSVIILKPLHTLDGLDVLAVLLILNITWHVTLRNCKNRCLWSANGLVVARTNILSETYTGVIVCWISSLHIRSLAVVKLAHFCSVVLFRDIFLLYILNDFPVIFLKESVITNILIDHPVGLGILSILGVELVFSEKVKRIYSVFWIEENLGALGCLRNFHHVLFINWKSIFMSCVECAPPGTLLHRRFRNTRQPSLFMDFHTCQ